MPDITVTLSDSQWAAYQATYEVAPTVGEVAAVLRAHLETLYQASLEGTDARALSADFDTKHAERIPKLEAFRA